MNLKSLIERNINSVWCSTMNIRDFEDIFNIDELMEACTHLSDEERKDLAEFILNDFYEKGWDVELYPGSLSVSKTEVL